MCHPWSKLLSVHWVSAGGAQDKGASTQTPAAATHLVILLWATGANV